MACPRDHIFRSHLHDLIFINILLAIFYAAISSSLLYHCIMLLGIPVSRISYYHSCLSLNMGMITYGLLALYFFFLVMEILDIPMRQCLFSSISLMRIKRQ